MAPQLFKLSSNVNKSNFIQQRDGSTIKSCTVKNEITRAAMKTVKE